jgi:hypothetical protein
MPSLKLIGMFAAIVLLGMALLYAQRSGLAQGRAEGEARYNALIAQHATTVADAVADARKQEQADTAKRAAAELALVRLAESRAIRRNAELGVQLRALKDAAHADPELARCLALPLPDGLRREPVTP